MCIRIFVKAILLLIIQEKDQSGKRLYSSDHTVKPPRDKNLIIILESNLTDLGALALERRYIRWYGRIDLGTGILRNMTDGGDGASNSNRKPVSEETKNKMRLSLKGRKLSDIHKENISKGEKAEYFLNNINKK